VCLDDRRHHSVPHLDLRHKDIPALIKAIAPPPVTVLNSLHPEPLLPHLMK
jgi:hypothetical protein